MFFRFPTGRSGSKTGSRRRRHAGSCRTSRGWGRHRRSWRTAFERRASRDYAPWTSVVNPAPEIRLHGYRGAGLRSGSACGRPLLDRGSRSTRHGDRRPLLANLALPNCLPGSAVACRPRSERRCRPSFRPQYRDLQRAHSCGSEPFPFILPISAGLPGSFLFATGLFLTGTTGIHP